jgi:glutamine amidotransferase
VKVAICKYGAGNVRSVELAFERLGASLIDDVVAADLAVLPGVGAARTAMAGLRDRGQDEALCARVTAGRPVLGICLGLQLALDWTDEDDGVAGLGLAPGRAVRIEHGRVPRMGWATVGDLGALYFAHSYAAVSPCATAWSEGLVAELRSGSFIGCQFHPEKSGAAGAAYLSGVLEEARSLSLV